MIKQVLKFGAITGASLVMMGGVAAAESTINTTGPGSQNIIINSSSHSNKKSCKVTNKNKVVLSNYSNQGASTGNAKVKHNTTGGSAVSGTAMNDNSTTIAADVANNNVDPCGGCGCQMVEGAQGGSIVNTGPRSYNLIQNGPSGNCGCKGSGSSYSNSNNVSVSNVSMQGASSGNASVSGNTTGGNATSGNASNTNMSDIVVTVSNN